MVARITSVEDVLAVFEMADQIDRSGGKGGPALWGQAMDDLDAYHGRPASSRIWSEACRQYDARHMSDEDYCANYGCDE